MLRYKSRITVLILLMVFLVGAILFFSATYQPDFNLHEYLAVQTDNIGMTHFSGFVEHAFLDSINRLFYCVGGAIFFIALFSSYIPNRRIAVQIRQLISALKVLEMGQFGKTVAIDSHNEVGELAAIFNRMSLSLAEHQTLRRIMFADLAHELRTPLTVIQGNLEGMLEGVIERSDETLNSLLEETEYLNRMVKDLHDLSLALAGQLKLEKAATDVNLVIHRAVSMLEPLAFEHNISIHEELKPSPHLLLDSHRLSQIIYNLLTNAIRYSPENGEVRVSTETACRNNKDWLLIEVIDNGCGILPEDMPLIFQHFYRVDKSRNKKSGGSGIGLAIVKQLVEIHGGCVEAHSEHEKGSRFSVFLPITGE